jgi:hypothetical protein
LIPTTIVANSMSGVSGAGRKADVSLLFCECNESARAYGVPKHRHLSEIEQELSLAAGETVVISFIPHLIPVNAGIATTTTATLRAGVSGGGRRGFGKGLCRASPSCACSARAAARTPRTSPAPTSSTSAGSTIRAPAG